MRDIWNVDLQRFLQLMGFDQPPSFCAHRSSSRKKRDTSHEECTSLIDAQTKVRVKARNGLAVLVWENKPWNDYNGWIGLFYSETASDQNYIVNAWQWTENRQSGSYETSIYISLGMQARLFREKYSSSVLRSPEMNEACMADAVKFSNDEDISIRLVFNTGSYAGVKLYVSKSHNGNWKDKYYYAWVGFYNNNQYISYQWLYNFWKIGEVPDYDVYTDGYNGGYINEGLEARVFNDEGYDHVIATTTPSWSC